MSAKASIFSAGTGQGKSFEEAYPGAVRGGTQIPDYAPKLGRGNATELTVESVDIQVGGNPRTALFNKIYIDNAPQIAARISEALTRDDKGFISSYSSGIGGNVGGDKGGFNFNFGGNYQNPVGSEKVAAVSRAFDVMYAEKVLEWANNNRNGAKIQIEGGQLIAYDKTMVDEIRTNATNLLERIKPKTPGTGVRGSVDGEELPSQSVAQASDRNNSVVASASTERQIQSGSSLDAFRNNPTVQQVSAALERNNGIPAENQNPSLVAGLAGAAARLPEVKDVALTPQIAFALDRDKSDPAANRVQVGMDVANKPFDEVWRTASVALQQAQTPAVVAQAQGQELEPRKSAFTM